MSTETTYIDSPVGVLKIVTDDQYIIGLDFCKPETKIAVDNKISKLAQTCIDQLNQYFTGKRKSFDLPLQPKGTDFQKQAWSALQKIPHGHTISYLQQATNIGNTKAVRAIGHANSKNPIAIIVPCHRVISKNGKLTGYAGELWRKEWLLNHEKTSK